MQYDFNLQPGGGIQIEVKGRFFKYRSGAGAIRVRASNGGYVDLLPGQGVWSLSYDSLTVQDRSGLQNAGVLIAGDFDFHDDRITGTVDVVDGGKARTLGGVAFLSSVSCQPLAGNMSIVQLWNPPASGRIAMVEQMTMNIQVDGDILMGFSNVKSPSGNLPGLSKISGGTNSVMLGCWQQSAVSVLASALQDTYCKAMDMKILKLSEPIIIRPGYGLVMQLTTPNSPVSVGFEYYEEAI